MRISGYGGGGYFNRTAGQNESSWMNSPLANSIQQPRKDTISPYGYSNQVGKRFSAANAKRIDKYYQSTIDSAAGLRKSEEKLTASGKESLFEKAKESGSTKEITQAYEEFVENYNAMIQGMKDIGGTINDSYRKELESYVKESAEELKEIGITLGKEGMLKLDKQVMEKAAPEALEKLCKGSGSFVLKSSVKSIYVEANAVSGRYAQNSGNDSMYGDYWGKSNYYGNSYNNYGSDGDYYSQKSPWRNYLR